MAQNTSFPVIKTNRLLMRQIIAADLPHVFSGLSEPDIIKYYGVSYSTLEETQAQMEFYADLERNGTGIYWAICNLGNNLFYGVGGLNGINREHRKAEVGFWLMKEYWGMGIMQEAMEIICHYGFTHLGLHRIEGQVETENKNCIKAMQKLGFKHEGTLQDYEFKNGRFISLDIYAKINEQ